MPTQRRRAGLETAITSLFSQQSVDFTSVELVVVDNDVVPSARPVAKRLFAHAPFRTRYIHEPRPGVASARNAALSATNSDLIAFLDDDEEASPNWLSSLIAAQAEYDADAVFGPVRGRIPTGVTLHRAHFEAFFSRNGPDRPGPMDGYFGCGNSIIRRAALPHPGAPFSVERNHGGGEDDLLFSTMKATGARFAWAPAAWVWEDPAPERINLHYTLRRAFGYGQAPVATCASATPPDWVGVAAWMGQGLCQAVLFAALAGLQRLRGPEGFEQSAERAARGLGKLLWWNRFKIAYYGLPPGVGPLSLAALKRRTPMGRGANGLAQ